jgi:O-antigen biosynthesis protein
VADRVPESPQRVMKPNRLSDRDALPSASLVIATRNRPALLERCLDGVAHQNIEPLEILVVDTTSGDPATQEVALRRGASYLLEPGAGIARARNHGAHASRGEIVAYLDDDAVPEPDWLSALLVEFFDPRITAVAGRILALAPQSKAEGSVIFGGPARLVVSRDTTDWFERTSFGGVGQGANLALRRSAFDAWPGFDERRGQGTPMSGMEEHHAFFSLVDRGCYVAYTPAAQVRHPYPRTQAELRARHLRQLTAASYHLSLLFAEEGRYRRRTAAYALGAIRGTSRPWRKNLGPAGPRVHGWQVALARARGVALYLTGCFESKRRQGPSRASQ